MKKQKLYVSPVFRVSSMDMQGIICSSVGEQSFGMTIDEFDRKDMESLDFDND